MHETSQNALTKSLTNVTIITGKTYLKRVLIHLIDFTHLQYELIDLEQIVDFAYTRAFLLGNQGEELSTCFV